MSGIKKACVYVKGMHCPSCDILVKKSFSKESNVRDVKPDYNTQTVEVTYTGSLSRETLNKRIQQYGYTVVARKQDLRNESYLKKLGEAVAIGTVLLILLYFAREFKLTSFFAPSSKMNYLTVFILGLVASTSTCMATSGALFLSTVGKLQDSKTSFASRIIPAVSFNIGRVLSYGVFGFLVGFIGNSLINSLHLGVLMNIIIAVVLLAIGLDMLKLLSLSAVTQVPFAKKLFGYLEERLSKNPRQTAFILGAITYLLPCGFTQSIQLYALGLANPVQSALTMTSFALGTVPVLLLFGFASSILQSNVYKQLSKVVAVVIVLVGLSYVGNTMRLYGLNLNFLGEKIATTQVSPNVLIKDGYQVATMNAGVTGYYPNTFTIKQGIPVRWVVKGENVYGCQGELVAPKIAVQKTLVSGENVIEFTPKEKGLISFSCAMGMFQGRFNVI